MKSWVMKLLPWVITSLIVGYIGLTTDLETVWATLREVNFIGFVPTVIAICIVVFMMDSWCLVRLFRHFNAPVSFREMLPLKGTSYFLNVINYNAAAAGIALFFRNRKGVGFLEALASMLWMNFIDIVALASLMVIGIAIVPEGLAEGDRTVLLGMAAAIFLLLIGSCIYWNAGFDWLLFGRFRTWTIFSTFAKARLSDYAFFLAIRIGFCFTYVFSQWVAMPFFDLDAPLRELVLYVPVITFIGTIPLTTIAGLGTVQVMMRYFYADFIPGGGTDLQVHAHIDAYSTTTILTFVLVRLVIGYLYMGSVSRDFAARASAAAAEAGQDEAATSDQRMSSSSTEIVK